VTSIVQIARNRDRVRRPRRSSERDLGARGRPRETGVWRAFPAIAKAAPAGAAASFARTERRDPLQAIVNLGGGFRPTRTIVIAAAGEGSLQFVHLFALH
jgi:hypothetical protein